MQRLLSPPAPQVLSAAFGSLERKTVDEVLWWVHEVLSAESGERFFRALMSNLCAVYGMKYAFITRCMDQPPTRVRSLAYWSIDHLRDDKAFALEGLPCDDMVRAGRPLWIPQRLAEQYPGKKDFAEGYCGMPLLANDERTVLGHIAFFSPGPMARNVFEDPLFHIFLSRATAELRRLAAEEQASERLAQLSHLARLGDLSEITSVVVHELAQPLTSIAMTARAAQRLAEARPVASARAQHAAGAAAAPDGPEALDATDATDAPDFTDPLEVIAEQAERASRLIRHIRGLARREGVPAAACDVNALVRDTVELAALEARRHSVTFRLELAEGLPPVPLVAPEFEQVVLNLARNAVEALAPAALWPREVVLATAVAAGHVRVLVRDNGPGLAGEARARLFQPFCTTKADGLGLGLSLSRALIEKVGGRLECEDLPAGQGACFVISLPCTGTTLGMAEKIA